MRGRNRVAAGAVTAVSVLALAACGPLGSSASGGGRTSAPAATAGAKGSTPLSGVAHAVTALDLVKKTAAGVHSARVESTISLGTAMSMSTRGALDWAHGLVGDLTLRYTSGAAADSLRKAGVPTTMNARYLPDAYYVNMGSAMASQLGGKHWVKYTYADLARFTGAQGSYLKDMIQGNNPIRSLDAALASPDTRNAGTSTVRGVRAVHYTGTVDLRQIAGRSLPNLSAADLSQLRSTLARSGVTTETVDLWVSEGNLPVETVITANTKAGVMKTTTYYSGFGTPVTAHAPAAFDTVDVSALTDKQ